MIIADPKNREEWLNARKKRYRRERRRMYHRLKQIQK